MPTILTIGHSNQPAAEFDALLQKHNIQRLIDVRSKPRARFGQFNRKALETRLNGLGIEYSYLGDKLGGYPDGDDFYDGKRVVYERVAGLRDFRRGIDQVIELSASCRLVLMCNQEDPKKCHRHTLLAEMLLEHGMEVLHIRRNGPIQDAATLFKQAGQQLPLLEPPGEDRTWVSPEDVPRQNH